MFAPIFQVCRASPAVLALLGMSPTRLWPFGEAEPDSPLPYAVWQTISGSPENYINQVPDVDSYSLQVDAYATTASGARAVAQAIRDAIEPHAHIVAWRGERRDRETRLYRFSFDVDWIVQR